MVIAKYENITKASQELYITQPSLSISLRKLEEEFGLQLFMRTPNRIKLNDAGKVVAEHVERILAEIDAMNSDLSLRASQNKLIHFCSPATASLRYFLPMFSGKYPLISTESSYMPQEKLLNALLTHNCDIVFSTKLLEHEGISNIPFCEEYQMLTVPLSHPLAKKDNVTLKDLNGSEILLINTPGYWNDMLPRLLSSKKINVKTHIVSDYVMYLQMKKNTQYLTISTNISRKYDPITETQKDTLIKDDEMRITYFIAYNNDNRRHVQCFLDWINDNYSTLLC